MWNQHYPKIRVGWTRTTKNEVAFALAKLKLSSSTKSATVDKVITKKHKEAVPNVEFTVAK